MNGGKDCLVELGLVVVVVNGPDDIDLIRGTKIRPVKDISRRFQ